MNRILLITPIMLAAMAATVSAADISIVFDNPDQVGVPGQTLSFFGVITNTDMTLGDQPIYLNSDSLNFTLSDATVMDNFIANVPISLAEGESSGDIDLFDITLANPGVNPAGVYPGTYELLGGMDGGAGTANDALAQADFSVNLVPEPGTFALMAVATSLLPWRRKARVTSR